MAECVEDKPKHRYSLIYERGENNWGAIECDTTSEVAGGAGYGLGDNSTRCIGWDWQEMKPVEHWCHLGWTEW